MNRIVLLWLCVASLSASLAGQTGGSAWIAWAREHHHPITSVQSSDEDTFEDLQFLKRVLQGRRIVQLGESGHGVAEFNLAKGRLIRFLHQQMGFDVIAFESGFFECHDAARTRSLSPQAMMSSCIFQVWHTREVLPLFEYIKSTETSARPLTLAGFDTQISSSVGVASRPAMLANLVRIVDPERAVEVERLDKQHISGMTMGSSSGYAIVNEPELTAFYGGLEAFFQEHRARIAHATGDPKAPLVAERVVWSMRRYLDQARIGLSVANPAESGGAVRDAGMAGNLAFLANELYPDRKILVWAHNFHIRHDNAATTTRQPSMGQFILEQFRDQLYTIGLYMNRGTAATNTRAVYSISPAPQNSMEWVMAGVGAPVLFMDFLHQVRVNDNSWQFESTVQREWGHQSFRLVPREQYDGVLFIDTVRSPQYLY